ncbi:FAD-binding oxidoreductase [Sulfitobacter sabulilitoris]|uniref:FAD-binding oxidoreductase n=1 Tax=Sulfitobacter sabulilitoris TaxID=2562655 RepID=A0A5S3PFV4_9RHOB|nr:FAD-binding oxidoreductase [Sulfitobacter sabulilitoris]TMM52927.1 FAD-binding oxidoreductase [Sulfitobacter sabulilitoris]
MTSISGKTDIDWGAFARALAPVEVINTPVLVKKRSRDFFWYSPILNAELKSCFGDLVARPRTPDEMRHVLAVAYAHDAPVVLRGGGTGNYGQAVPVNGGLIIETTAMNRVIEVGDGFVRAEAGALMADINAALIPQGREMAMFPSTQDIATVGGFVAGGSAGIGSVANGALRDPGNIIALKVQSLDATPREHLFEGVDTLHIHHAWGINGVITEVSLRTVPTRDWVGCMATFDRYEDAYAAGHALARDEAIACKLVSTADARICAYFPRLDGHIRKDRHLLVSLLPQEDVAAFRALITQEGGHVDLTLTEDERIEAKLPHVFDFSYNHTTLQVLKADRKATYQQVGCPAPPDPRAIARLRPQLGDDVWMHHEFARVGGQIVTFDLPIIWFSGRARLDQINAIYEDNGFPVHDAHTWRVEGGGLKTADYRHLAWKKRLDPKGLLNSAKSAAWDSVKHLSAAEIEALETAQ